MKHVTIDGVGWWWVDLAELWEMESGKALAWAIELWLEAPDGETFKVYG
jgi:hypothetical protein